MTRKAQTSSKKGQSRPAKKVTRRPSVPRCVHDAIHEAGHAIALIATGHGSWITKLAARTKNGRGFCESKEAWDLSRPQDLADVVAYSMAGMEAERRIWKKPVATYLHVSGNSDVEEAIAALRIGFALGVDEVPTGTAARNAAVDQWLEAGRARAREIVKTHWAAVRALARALLESTSLTGTEVRTIAINADPALDTRGGTVRRSRHS
jgi:hypothetical protein